MLVPGGHLSQGPQPVPATSQACHALGLSRSPNSHNLLPGVLGGPPPVFFLQAASWLLESQRKWSTSGPNSSRASRSKSRRAGSASSSSQDSGPLQGGLYSKKGVGLSSSCTQCHLLVHPWDLLLWWSWLLEWAWHSSQPWVMDQLSHSISSSKAAAVARALQWASLTLVRPLSASSPSWGFCF